MSLVRPTTNRIASLDQFRGYTVAGMFLVNFVGGFVATPILFTHKNTFCSYADTIMPGFFFAVGFAFRLTFGRRAQTEGLPRAYVHVVRRLLGLALVALVVYGAPTAARTWQEFLDKGPWQALWHSIRDVWFQTLMHIAVTSLWILPVIRSGALVRIAYMIASAALQVGLSHWFYFEWVNGGIGGGGIDGGVLGFLSWTIPTIVGTLACDAVTAAGGRPRVAAMIVGGAVLMAAGWLMSCGTTLYDVPAEQVAELRDQRRAPDPVIPSPERMETHRLAWAEPPFVPPPDPDHRKHNYWMMSQRAATVSYHTFAAGFSLALYALFYIACDVWGWQLGVFRTLGTNALVAYVLHGMVDRTVSAFMPRDSPGWYVTAG
ncbi:MAG: acyltransferase family protein, partial [Pirellulales bacterium]